MYLRVYFPLLTLLITVLSINADQPIVHEVLSDAARNDSLGTTDVVTLSTTDALPLPPLRAVGYGCGLRPLLQCHGPIYCTCTPRIYYGTNPRDDDWTNPLFECADGTCGTMWYRHARRMITRKKHIAEQIVHD